MSASSNRRARARAERPSLVDAAYQELRRRILENQMPPGTQALEQELAATFGMSRTPIREALIRLAQEGLVEVRPRHGMRVLPMASEDMRQIYDIITALEAAAAERMALRPDAGDGVVMLDRLVTEMAAALDRDDLDEWVRADEAFHTAVLDLSGNRRLAQIANTYRDQVHRARMLTLRLRPKPFDSVAEHQAVADAIRHGDAPRARERLREHRQRAGTLLVSLLESHQLD